MDLQEPKKKKRVKLKPQLPFPIVLNKAQEWPIYTAHLTDTGSCIIDPKEIQIVHSMGFFGKGSLSRSFPSFGKAKYGAPPVVRHRQWLRRQDWMKEVKELNNACISECEETVAQRDEKVFLMEKNKETNRDENIAEIVEVAPNSSFVNENDQMNKCSAKDVEIEVVSDSTEEDDICVIVNRTSDKCEKTDNMTQDNINSLEEEKDIEELYNLNYYDFKSSSRYMGERDDLKEKLLVLPDSDTDMEDYLRDIKPKIEDRGFPIQEALHLTFEETFFLLFGLGCLQLIHFDGSLLNINNTWSYFCKEKTDFLQRYVVYHYYRSKGWVVKPALKYGGDFLLYKEGPPFYHASYIVIIEVLDADSLVVDTTKSMHSMSWNSLFGLGRLSETAAKEILFAQVLWPSSVSQDTSATSPEVLSEFTVRELLWRRWNPKQHREDVPEEEDEESC